LDVFLKKAFSSHLAQKQEKGPILTGVEIALQEISQLLFRLWFQVTSRNETKAMTFGRKAV
jgi:hypothetical protein